MREYIRNIPDFPKSGVMFRDISPLLSERFPEAITKMSNLLTAEEWASVDLIGGIEARGFVMAAGLAAVQKKGFVGIRKAGKLPQPVVRRSYGLEYGEDALEMRHGTGRILIVDDVLATGGTLKAAAELSQESGHEVRGFLCLIDLKYLNDFSWNGFFAKSLIVYGSE